MQSYPCPPLKSAPATEAYRANFDRIFGPQDAPGDVPGSAAPPTPAADAPAPSWRRDETGLVIGLGMGRQLRFVPCDACEGLGQVIVPARPWGDEPEESVAGCGQYDPCDPCGAFGWFLEIRLPDGDAPRFRVPS